jgi:hypothetical protein
MGAQRADDYYAHASDLPDPIRPLPIGTRVTFQPTMHQGRKHARNVKPLPCRRTVDAMLLRPEKDLRSTSSLGRLLKCNKATKLS